MNCLDFDALSRVGRHDVPTLVAAALSQAESIGASGKNLILATAIAFEISQKLRLAVQGIHAPGAERDKMLWPAVSGYSVATLGAAVGTGKLLNLNQEQVLFFFSFILS